MPDPNSVSTGASQGRVDLSNAPLADQDWDMLFPNPEVQTALQTQPAQGTPPSAAATSTTEPFLKAGTTVYNTAEDAIQGTAHKDDLIAKYRSFLQEQGVDPNTFQRVQQVQTQTVQPPAQTSNSQYKYYGNVNFFDEVAAAATKGDKARYVELMDAHTREAISANLDPWRGTLVSTNRLNAIRQTTNEIPGFAKFYGSPEYQKVVENIPLYKDVINVCENDPNAAGRLHEAYKAVYLTYQGMNQTQAQSQATTSTTQTTPTVQQRQTLQHSSLTPPAPVSSTQGWQESNWRGNKPTGNEARKQLIQDGDAKFQGMRFDDVGL